jgi:hypothetical protein
MDEVKWFNVVSKFSGYIVHCWQQLGLNRECCVTELQHLSRKTSKRIQLNESPLLEFKGKYMVLFECLNAVFGLMMSNSRLYAQIHGMMRHGLRSGLGMDQVKAQQSCSTSTDYEMKQECREMVLEEDGKPAAKT